MPASCPCWASAGVETGTTHERVTAGAAAAQAVYAATASDVHAVVQGGRIVVRDGEHVLGDVGRLLAEAIEPLWENA